jgi:acetolactate synthase-1/2/3 large subunit
LSSSSLLAGLKGSVLGWRTRNDETNERKAPRRTGGGLFCYQQPEQRGLVSDHPPYTGSDLVLDVLHDEGVELAFGYPGGAIMPLYDKLAFHQVAHYLVRHEQAAAFAAGGYARACGRVGVCFATSGPGATNLVTGLVDALMDSVPVVAITAQVRSQLMGTDAFQEADVTAITHAATKRNVLIRSIAELEPALRSAFRSARGPRPGPVLIDITTDVLRAPVERPQRRGLSLPKRPARSPQREAIRTAIALIRHAGRPVVIAGGGVRLSGAHVEYRRLLELLHAPHTATVNALGSARRDDPRFLGMLGMHGWKAANLAVARADLVIALGMRFDDRVTGRVDRFAQSAKVIHADIDRSEFGKVVGVDVSLHGDLRDTLADLVAELEAEQLPSFAAWNEEAHSLGGALPTDRTPNECISATDVLDRLFATAPADAIVTTDVGQHQMWAAQRAKPGEPSAFITSGGLGAMGFGLPAAIGAAIAHPGRPVAAIVGDGGFQMSFAELATLKRYNVPVKILLIDNQRLGMVRQWQELFYDRRYSATDLSDNPDFVMIARAYGIAAELLETPADLDAALERFWRADGPVLLQCACHPHENVWPLVPPGGSTSEAMEAVPA